MPIPNSFKSFDNWRSREWVRVHWYIGNMRKLEYVDLNKKVNLRWYLRRFRCMHLRFSCRQGNIPKTAARL